MRIVKAILPLLIFIALALYLRHQHSSLPESLIEALQYLPPLLMLFAIIIALHFDQIRVLTFIIILVAVYYCIEQQLLDNQIKLTLFSTFTPILLWLLGFIKEKNILSIKALPVYLLLTSTLLVSLWLIREQPLWIDRFLITSWLPFNLPNFNAFSDTTLVIFGAIFLLMLIRLYSKPDQKNVTALALLFIVFICTIQTMSPHDFIIIISTGLLLCIFCILQESWKMAYLDELTQLPGRRALTQKLRSIVGLYSIAMVDIDFFKKFNDKYGHDVGDLALIKVAQTLQKVSGGSAYRYGGEEFTIVFPNKSAEQTIDALETIRLNLAESQFQLPEKVLKKNQKPTVKITISIGVSDSIDINTAQETMKQADNALYKAKKKGRNRIEITQ